MGSVDLSAMKVLSSPSLILIRPWSLPSLPIFTIPVPMMHASDREGDKWFQARGAGTYS